MAPLDAPALAGVTSVRTRMHRSFLVLVLLLLATGLTGIVAVATVEQAMERLVERDAPALGANASVLQALTDAETGERGFLVTGVESFLAPFDTGRAAFTGHLADSRRFAQGDPELVEAVEAEASSAQEWLEGFAEPVIELRRRDASGAAALASTGEGRRRFDRFRAANAVSADLFGARGEANRADAERLAHVAIVVVAVIVVLGCSAAAVVASRTTAAVALPLGRLRLTLADMAGGDLDRRAAVSGPEEISAVARSVNVLAAANAELMARRLEVESSQRSALAREREVVEHLRDLDRIRQQVVGTMSHELRTPLTSIAGYVELLRDEDAGPLNDEQRRLLTVVERNADRLLRLSEDVLTLSSVESAGFRLQLTTISPARMLASVREAMLPAAAGRGVSLESEVGEDVGSIAGDEGQLERVLLNLVSNAIKFTPPRGRVTMAATRRSGSVELVVADTGVGIPEAEQERLFSPFFRAETARVQQVQGTGLGLAIVQTIVERHGGTVSLSSLEGVGTTVRVVLPVAAVDPTAADEAELGIGA